MNTFTQVLLMASIALMTITAPLFDWIMNNGPGYGFAVFAIWLGWRYVSWLNSKFSAIIKTSDQHEVKLELLNKGQMKMEAAIEALATNQHQMQLLIVRLDNKIDVGSARLESKIDAVAERLDNKIDAVAERLESKIDGVSRGLETKIDTVSEKFHTKIDAVAEKLDSKIDAVAEKLDTRIDAVSTKVDCKLP